ncbi:MAG TPA: hypothetical protein VK487_00815 [Candidatus Bathyarchaeia archaeon]|nr:hypothetical protein [Candidatus Bathyarchaeia archaeon]
MPHYFEWNDYRLNGPPSISLEDYTFNAFGCRQIISDYLNRIRKIRNRQESIRWILMDFWGRGKSTLAYNLCHMINAELFFSPRTCSMLAIFVDHPQRASDLLNYSYENGLAVPWKPEETKEDVYDARKRLFAKALRILAAS